LKKKLKNKKMAINKILLIIICLVKIQIVFSQYYIPPKRDTVSLEWYNNSVKILNREKHNLETGEYKTRRDTCMHYYQIGITYANLHEPSDSIFFFLNKALLLDSFRVCRALLFRDSLVSANKRARPIFEVDSNAFKIYKYKCEICIELELKRRDVQREQALNDTSVNKDLVLLLKNMLRNDQLYRNEMNKHSRKKVIDSLWVLQNKVDSLNERLLDSLFIKYGYPDKKLITQYYQLNAGIILLHMSNSFQRKHLSLIINAYHSETVDASTLMMVLDKIYGYETGKQLFGTQSYNDGRNNMFHSKEDAINILKSLSLEQLKNELRTE
jgi:hypothetical protein